MQRQTPTSTSNPSTLRGRRALFSLVALGVALALGGLASGCSSLIQMRFGLPEFRNTVDDRVVEMVAMRDGVRLATDVYTPATPGPWPVVVVRDPYSVFDALDPLMQALCRYGYAVVHQDVRGRLRSEGVWNPIEQERFDGIDTVNWVKEQPFFNGKMALYGPSYLGIAQWSMLADLPPEVKTIIPQVSSTNLYDVVYEDGMFRHEVLSFWASAMPDNGLAPLNALTYQSAIRESPNSQSMIHVGEELPWYRRWQQSVSPSAPLWQNETLTRTRAAVATTTVPMLIVGGWYDIFLRTQLEDWERLGSQGQSRYIVGPWTHLMGLYGDGEKAFPGAGGFGLIDDKVINWLDHHLKGTPLDEWGPIHVYRIGENEWEDRNAWPETTAVDFYLGSGQRAQSCEGGSLDSLSGPSGSVAFVYDPNDPVPTNGGSQLLSWVVPGYGGAPASNRDQSKVCERADVLTFVSPKLGTPFHLSGPMTVDLRVSSSAPDTAFTAKLIEIDAEGNALNIRDGITSLGWRNGASTLQPYSPHSSVSVRIDLSAIEWTLHRGSRLRLDISSSNFPAFHAHPNRVGVWSDVEDVTQAHQTVYLGGGQSVLRVGRRVEQNARQ